MTLSSDINVLLVGCFGGLAAEALHWWNLRTTDRLPQYGKKLFYWIITVIMILVGGGIAWLQFGSSGEAWVVFQIGVAAPLILQKLTTSLPTPEGQMGMRESPQGSIRNFFTW